MRLQWDERRGGKRAAPILQTSSNNSKYMLQSILQPLIGKKVLIRSYSSGIHFGTLEQAQPLQDRLITKLLNSRRIHYWNGACSCSQIAEDGITSGRVAITLPTLVVADVIEIIPLSERATSNLESQEVWKS